MDKDSISSFLAQVNKGLQIKLKEEMRNANTFTAQEETGEEFVGNVSGGIPMLGAKVDAGKSKNSSESRATETFWDQVEEKELHDYAFDKVYDYLVHNGKFKAKNYRIGDAIELKEKMTFMDFGYFERMYQENGGIYYSVMQKKKELAEAKKTMPKGANVPVNVKMQIRQAEEQIHQEEKNMQEYCELIKMLQNTIPYKRFAMTEDALVLLEDKCFRDNPDVIPFKYGGELNLVGYVTNIVQGEPNTVGTVDTNTMDFGQIYEILNSVLLSLYNGKNKIVIIHPLVIYY